MESRQNKGFADHEKFARLWEGGGGDNCFTFSSSPGRSLYECWRRRGSSSAKIKQIVCRATATKLVQNDIDFKLGSLDLQPVVQCNVVRRLFGASPPFGACSAPRRVRRQRSARSAPFGASQHVRRQAPFLLVFPMVSSCVHSGFLDRLWHPMHPVGSLLGALHRDGQ